VALIVFLFATAIKWALTARWDPAVKALAAASDGRKANSNDVTPQD
jgi:hypothetical protein